MLHVRVCVCRVLVENQVISINVTPNLLETGPKSKIASILPTNFFILLNNYIGSLPKLVVFSSPYCSCGRSTALSTRPCHLPRCSHKLFNFHVRPLPQPYTWIHSLPFTCLPGQGCLYVQRYCHTLND